VADHRAVEFHPAGDLGLAAEDRNEALSAIHHAESAMTNLV
jgi:hypothetical protein